MGLQMSCIHVDCHFEYDIVAKGDDITLRISTYLGKSQGSTTSVRLRDGNAECEMGN